MNRLKINNKKDSRSSRLIGGAGRGGDEDGGGKICKLAAAPKATLSDEFASSSDEWDVNSNGSQVRYTGSECFRAFNFFLRSRSN